MARRRRVFRVLLPVAGLCLLGVLAWVIIAWFLRPPKLDLIAIAVADYRNPEAPPIPYCYEDLEALRNVLDADGAKNSALWNDATSEGIAELRTALRETSNSHDNVLVYIKAHGVSLNGAAYLLGGDFELGVSDAGRLPVEQLLNHVAESPARIKLLVLDTGHLESDPRMGMLTNEFTHLLTQAVKSLPADKNVWVLTSNSLFERTQVSLKDRRSAFGYYLAEGLKGRADGVLAGRDRAKTPDRLVQLDELYNFVRDYVVQYARTTSDDRQSQTPLLLRSGEGEVTNPPHEVLLRIEPSEEPDKNAEEEKVAFRRGPSAVALALVGFQAAAGGTDDGAKASTSQPAVPAATKEADPTAPGAAAKETKTAGDQATSPAAKEGTKTEAKPPTEPAPPTSAAASSKEGVPKPAARKRSTVEQSLFDYDAWLYQQQNRADGWRPTDYAPDLTRLYCESLAGCRERALAGDLFLNSPDYQVSLDRKLSEMRTLQVAIGVRLKAFESGAARPTYERDDKVRQAIRLRNDSCHLLPLLAAHHSLISANTQPTMQRDLLGLIEATSELDRLLAHKADPQQPNSGQAFEIWKQTLATQEALVRTHLERLTSDFQARSDEQNRLLAAGGNATVARRLADLAQSPLAAPERREELQAVARSDKAAHSFAEVEKQYSLPLRPSPVAEQQRLTELAWERVVDRAELELALAALMLGDKQDGRLADAQKSFALAGQTAEAESRLAALRKIDEFLNIAYRELPERLRERLRSKSYDAWRAAETAVRLADARDQNRIEKILSDRIARQWTDPIAGVPLAALPELNKTHRLALGDTSLSSSATMSLNFGVAEKVAVRFRSNSVLPDRLRLRLKYDNQRLQVKDAAGAALASDTVRELPAATRGNAATEQRMELLLESRDQRGEQTSLLLVWLDENNVELAEATLVLAHPEPVFSRLAVYGQRDTAEHTWQSTPQGEFYFDVPFSEGVGQVRLLPFSGHETRYDFRLTNNAKYPKKYAVAIYAIPPADDPELRRTPAALIAAAETRGRVLARNELAIGPGRTESIRFDSPPPAATKDAAAAPDAAKTASDKPGGAAKEPPPDVSFGLVCVLSEDTKPTEGKEPPNSRRQVILIEAETPRPQFYITPRLDYRNGEIAAVLSVPDVNRLPADGSRVELEVITNQLLGDARARYVTRLTRQSLDGDSLRAYVRAGALSRAQIFLNVDDYPRAFIYDLPLDASLPNVERRLDSREIALPDAKNFPLYYDGTVSEPLAFPFRVDMPTSRDGSFRVRVFIGDTPGSDYDPRTRMLESSEDRVHKVALIKREDAPGLALQSKTSDLVAMLDLSPYKNQPVYVRVQLVARAQGDETVLADKDLKIFLDGTAPLLDAQRPTNVIYDNKPFAIKLDARDDISDVKQVQFALKTQTMPDGKGGEVEVLVEPKPVPNPRGAYQLTHTFEKPGTQSLFFQATDMRGNKSEIEQLEINVRPTPTVTADKGAQVPVAQLGRIMGRASLPEGVGGTITKVILSRGGQVYRVANKPADGKFDFDKLPPGEYEVKAEGTIAGNFGKPVPVNVTVEPGKTTDPGPVQLGR